MSTKKARYQILAITLATIGIAAFVVSCFAYSKYVGSDILDSASSWGLFGDFIGGFAGTAIALTTLIALAITLFLQARALEETRSAVAQQLAAANNQLTSFERNEALKLRPLLKAEWFPAHAENHMEWRVRNIGLGPAIIDRIDIYVSGLLTGTHSMDPGPEWHNTWWTAIKAVINPQSVGESATFYKTPMTYLKRGLGAGEYQAMVGFQINDPAQRSAALLMLNSEINVIIHFRSMAGESLSTWTQFEFGSTERDRSLRSVLMPSSP